MASTMSIDSNAPSVISQCVFDDMTYEQQLEALDLIKTEADFAITSGDMALQKWARSTGLLASVVMQLLEDAGPPTPPATQAAKSSGKDDDKSGDSKK